MRFVVAGLDSDEGHVLCALFQGEDNWLEPEQHAASARATVRDGRAVCVFRDVPAGTDAISAFHDEDDNVQIATGTFGIPTKDWCASRDTRGVMGLPRYRDASFDHTGATTSLRARVR